MAWIVLYIAEGIFFTVRPFILKATWHDRINDIVAASLLVWSANVDNLLLKIFMAIPVVFYTIFKGLGEYYKYRSIKMEFKAKIDKTAKQLERHYE